MNNNTVDILAAEPRVVKFGDREIHVREISWLDLLRFIELVSAKAADLLRIGEGGKAVVDMAKLPELIKGSSELSAHLLKACTDAENPEQFPARVVLRLVDVALEQNLTEEFLSAGKSVATRLASAVPSQAKAQSAASSKP